MKTIVRNVKSDFIKMKHTSILWIHIMIPILGALMFLGYFALYRNVKDEVKVSFVTEILVCVYPIIIGVIVGMMLLLEEKAGHFKEMLAVSTSRKVPVLSKLILSVLMGAFSVFLTYGLLAAGCQIFHLLEVVPVVFFLKICIQIIMGNIILYLFHIFLSIRFGLGCSIFVGVFEGLLTVLFSNIDVSNLWSFIPSIWGIKLTQQLLQGGNINGTSIFTMAVIFAAVLIIILMWFSRWEGRKYYE